MDAALVRRYCDRWQAVEEVEAAEQKAATPTDRWLQTNAALRLAVALGLDMQQYEEESGEEAVWLRWSRLKDLA